MPFQFYCPQGHLLEGHESQMGQPSQCPMCGSQFIIPVVGAAGGQVQQPFPGGAAGMPPPGDPNPFAGVTSGPNFGHLAGAVPPAPEPAVAPPQEPEPEPPAEPAPPPEPRIVRIPCEKCGQHLHTPDDMFGQRAMCPYCNHQFDLKYEASIEYQEEQAELKRRREEQINKFFLTWAIRAAIIVAVLLVGMIGYIVYSSM